MNSIDAEHILIEIEKTLLAHCRQQGLFQPGEQVIAACSGGADSMALLRFLLRCRETLGISVRAAHVDHGIRGEASHADAAFVREFCRRNDVPFFLYDARAEGIVIPEHPSEDWARRLRYGWFDTLAAKENAVIATAHTLSDQAETLLFRLARGTGVHGLAGIPPKRGHYVRPFLCLTREQTVAYCGALGQKYVQDETNADDHFARNRLRHQAVPALCGVNSSALYAMGRLCDQMRELDEWLCAQAQALLDTARRPQGYDLAVLRAADGPVLTQALRTLVVPSRDAEEKYIRLLRTILLQGHGAVQITDNVLWRVEGSLLVRCEKKASLPAPAAPQPLSEGSFHLPGGYLLQIQLMNYEVFLKNPAFFKKDYTYCADYAKIDKNILLRTRQPGDVFRPAGRYVGKKLKKYFNEIAVPVSERALLPLLAEDNQVIWIWGVGFAQGMEPGDQTRKVLVLKTKKE